MVAFTTSVVVTELQPNSGYKEITVTTPLVGSGATVALTLKDHGITATGLLSVEGISISTVYGVIVTEAPTTVVSAGVLTITSGTQTGSSKTFRITGESN